MCRLCYDIGKNEPSKCRSLLVKKNYFISLSASGTVSRNSQSNNQNLVWGTGPKKKIQTIPELTQQQNPTPKRSQLWQLELVDNTYFKDPEEEIDFRKQAKR